ncbi:UNVERIFIED_CONTAM: hypothetical protein ABIC26_003386 [Paenibacillus sp. PvR008]
MSKKTNFAPYLLDEVRLLGFATGSGLMLI